MKNFFLAVILFLAVGSVFATPTATPTFTATFTPTVTSTPVPPTGHVNGTVCSSTTPVVLIAAPNNTVLGIPTSSDLVCNILLNNSSAATCRVQVYNSAETLIGPLTLGAEPNGMLNLWSSYTFTSHPNMPIYLKCLDSVSCIEYSVQFRLASKVPYPW